MFEKITETALRDNGVVSASDILSGTAQANKEVFDRVAKNVIVPAFNELINLLNSAAAPEHIGAEGGTLKDLLDGVKQNLSDVPGMIDTKVAEAIADSAAEMNSAIEATHILLAGKVDKEEGKGLSDNSYTTAEKAKLEGIENGAQVNVIESIHINGEATAVNGKTVNLKIPTPQEIIENNNLVDNKKLSEGLEGKVSKDGEKVLSDNNYTTAEKEKLAGVETGANFSKISVKTSDAEAEEYSGSKPKFRFDRGGIIADDCIFINALTEEDCEKLDGLDANLEGKVSKEEGKGLSEENFTKEEKEKLAELAEGWTFIKSDTLSADASAITVAFEDNYKEVYVRMIVPTMISDEMPTVPAGRVYVYANEYHSDNVILKENSALFTDTTGESLNLNYRIRMVDRYCNIQRQHSYGDRQANASATANSTISGLTDIRQAYLEALVFVFSPTTRVFPIGTAFEIWGVKA